MRSNLLAVFLVCVSLASVEAGSPAARQTHLTDEQAKDAIKKLLEEQDSPRCGRGKRYCDMKDIVLGGNVQPPRNQIHNLQERMVDSVTIEISDYWLRVTRSEDQKHFQVSLTPSKQCGDAWFTDERKTVYLARQEGCPPRS